MVINHLSCNFSFVQSVKIKITCRRFIYMMGHSAVEYTLHQKKEPPGETLNLKGGKCFMSLQNRS